MADLTFFDEASVQFWNRFREFNGRDIIYWRAGKQYKINVLVDAADAEAYNVAAALTVFSELKTITIVAADLPFSPEQSDCVYYRGKRFELLAGDGHPVFRYTDDSELAYTIHVYAISEEDSGDE